jgi:EAL domain-containing protein (putative c-di-GMP-specific phosphodiesterase class I)
MLPEDQISTHLKLAQAFRLKMSNLGVMVGLDQFGGGFEGRGVDPDQILSHFGADRLRLSSHLVEGLMDANKTIAAKAILGQVKAQNREILASGVESAGTMSALFNAGTDYAQGSFLAQVSSKMDHEF